MQGLVTGCGTGLALVCLMLGGCSDLKKNLGLTREMPNEFMVSPYQQQLEIPPSYDLKPPRKGDASTSAPFRENPYSTGKHVKLSPSEKALMRDLGPGISPKEERGLDDEAIAEQHALERNKGPLEGKVVPYKRQPGHVIDPRIEPATGRQVAPCEMVPPKVGAVNAQES